MTFLCAGLAKTVEGWILITLLVNITLSDDRIVY
jgi:hypothetical protein